MYNYRDHRGTIFLALAFLCVTPFTTLAQSSGGILQVTSSTVAGGGGASTGGTVKVQGTGGQPAAGASLSKPPFSVGGGFWQPPPNSSPTAAAATISGQVTTVGGLPVAGVVMRLSGGRSAVTITAGSGHYSFSNIATEGFYSITPELANFSFSPGVLSFSLLGNKTDAIFTATAIALPTANPLDTGEFFVRQHYLDFLGREPDQSGFAYWSAQINQCGGDLSCVRTRRIDVSAAFFVEQEFQLTGSFIYDVYAASLDRRPAYNEYSADRQYVVGGANLDASKTAFAESFAERAEFAQKYAPTLSAASLVDSLIQNARQATGVDLGDRRDGLLALYASGTNQIQSRALVLRAIADDASVKQAKYNAAFVLAQYFGYLHRDPDQAGYDFWLGVLNNAEPNNYRAMVCAFITSAEYQRRFGSVITQSNASCATVH